MVRFAIGLFLICCSAFAAATFQQPDVIRIAGESYETYTYVLDQYFSEHPEQLPKADSISTGRWRGYIGHYEIEGDRLYIGDILVSRYMEVSPEIYDWPDVSAIDEVFPDPALRLASWYSGIIAIPLYQEPELSEEEAADPDYIPPKPDYWLFNIQNGAVVDQTQMTPVEYEQYQNRQYEAFRVTSDYFEQRQTALDAETELALKYRDPNDFDSNELVSEESVEDHVRYESKYSEQMVLPFKDQ